MVWGCLSRGFSWLTSSKFWEAREHPFDEKHDEKAWVVSVSWSYKGLPTMQALYRSDVNHDTTHLWGIVVIDICGALSSSICNVKLTPRSCKSSRWQERLPSIHFLTVQQITDAMDLVRLLLKEDSQHRQDEHFRWSRQGIRADSLRFVMAKQHSCKWSFRGSFEDSIGNVSW